MSAPDNDRITVTFHGRPNVGDLGELLLSLDELFGDAGMAVTAMRWKCDGCGVEVERIPDDWTRSGEGDLCPNCTPSRPKTGEETTPTQERGQSHG